LFYPTAPHRIQPATSIAGAGKRITPDEGDFDAWAWGFGDYMTEVMQGYKPTIRYILEVIRTAGPFIGIVGFSAGATTAHTLVSLAERRDPPSSCKTCRSIQVYVLSAFQLQHGPKLQTPG
jgi:hypothetical protein